MYIFNLTMIVLVSLHAYATTVKHSQTPTPMKRATLFKYTKHMYSHPTWPNNAVNELVRLKQQRDSRPTSLATPSKNSLMRIFENKEGFVTQVAVEHYRCGLHQMSKKEKAAVNRATQEEITYLAHELMNSITHLKLRYLDKKDFKSLESNKLQTLQNPYKNSLLKTTRLKKSLYKCDSKGGLGYRFDIFFKN